MSQEVEIGPGLDLDVAVLEALGAAWRDEWKDKTGWKMAAWYYEDGSVACREQIPQFSTDLNAAFAAAEKAYKRFWVKKLGPDKYEAIVFFDGDKAGLSLFDWQSTPALAICAAILKAKGCNFMAGRLDAMSALGPVT